MRFRSTAWLSLLALVTANAFASGVPEKDLKEYGRGIITDYSNMHEGEDIQWYWVADGTRLAEHNCSVGSVKNLTVVVDHGMRDVFKEELPEVLKRACTGDAEAAPLTVDVGIYWAERANTSKAWIPFVGGHVMQAGVGIELVFKNAQGQPVATIRQSGREGGALESASRELMDDVAKFTRSH